MSADSEHPRSWGPDEDEDQALGLELAAFPAEDEPIWEELEYLEYLDDTEGVDDATAAPANHTSFASPGQFDLGAVGLNCVPARQREAERLGRIQRDAGELLVK